MEQLLFGNHSVPAPSGWALSQERPTSRAQSLNSALESETEALLSLVKMNVVSPGLVCKLAIPTMAARGRGRVILSSSLTPSSPGPFRAISDASKAFVQSFADAIAAELADSGVTVVSLLPGPPGRGHSYRSGLEPPAALHDNADAALTAETGFEARTAGRATVFVAPDGEPLSD